jgi:hypothetical protein
MRATTMLLCRLLVSAGVLLPIGGMAQMPDNCEPVRAQIEQKIASNGVLHFALTVVDAEVSALGQVVGRCAQGRKKIIYTQGLRPLGPSAQPAGPSSGSGSGSDIVTECRDGTVSLSGRCKP